jgi:hypothetical protein
MKGLVANLRAGHTRHGAEDAAVAPTIVAKSVPNHLPLIEGQWDCPAFVDTLKL